MALAKCGAISESLQVSASLPQLTVFSWTAIISAYADCGLGHEALSMHQHMLDSGIEPDKYTFVSLFEACGCIHDLERGKRLHTDAREKGFTVDVFSCNTLVSMYGKCGAIFEAEEVFCGMSCHTRISWNAMLSAYVDSGFAEHALLLFRQIQTEGRSPNEPTFVLAIQACSSLVERELTILAKGEPVESVSLQIGRAIHVDAQRMGYTSDISVGSALVSMYGKYGSIPEAESAFSNLSDANVVSWTAVISTYVNLGQGVRGLQLFTQMHRIGTAPNQLTFIFALQALGVLMEDFSRQEQSVSIEVPRFIVHALHEDSDSQGYTSDPCVGNLFVSMYGKCGAVFEAETIYQGLLTRDVVASNAMLFVYIGQGEIEKASQLIKQMQIEHASLDEVSIIYMLQLSREVGSVGICYTGHFYIVSAGQVFTPIISATLIHAYGTCGSSVDAEMVLEEGCLLDERPILHGLDGHSMMLQPLVGIIL
ncbi:hypothetical protein L7F22_068529 [Adiantum nelumboides]|nr:hypothetical protein [Adiantum nelumboides]